MITTEADNYALDQSSTMSVYHGVRRPDSGSGSYTAGFAGSDGKLFIMSIGTETILIDHLLSYHISYTLLVDIVA